ncbi:sugar ABC transporter ATP-binding protein [Mesorhizobium atlanticum]|uniref:D-xylose ABC transporter ATP-binding protein n=1 Tax=Mesorhizobium atlanticum TaxID=2233532 RepID=A0A330GV54_9HYPH|nr:sugar ABC transporter ATP-binding protein [Mesorhizobium atlanticum]RAZ78407.1 D-xylose ABC transporter ATP-binding protein [Mesorhizobium atlanticum]
MTDEPASPDDVVVQVRELSKVYPGVTALSNVEFDLRRGEIHALIGENGAGKSSLIRILSGDSRPSAGVLRVNGKLEHFSSPQDARRAGIVTVFQELSIVPALTVAENVVLGNQPATDLLGRIYSRRLARERTRSVFQTLGVSIDPDCRAETLSTGEMQLVEIARALLLDAPVLILDEPTASLSDSEAARLLDIMVRLRNAGKSLIFVSHRLGEALKVADRITVLRNGERVETRERHQVADTSELIQMMVGGRLERLFPTPNTNIGGVLFSAEGLTRRGKFEDISFAIRSGEILGFSGLVGAGRTEVMRSIIGADPLDAGRIVKHGVHFRVRDPRHAIETGIAYLSEDRKGAGLVLSLSGYENIVLSAMPRMFRSGYVNWTRVRAVASEIAQRMRFRGQLGSMTSTYSGGNQQKIAIGKCILSGADLLIFDEPTRGVDIGAKAEIYQLLHEAAEAGAAVVVVSSELPELMNIAHRILVMSAGRITGSFARSEFDEKTLLAAAFAGHAGANDKAPESLAA